MICWLILNHPEDDNDRDNAAEADYDTDQFLPPP